MNCKHTGPHLVILNGRMGDDFDGPTIAEHARQALNHAVDSDEAAINEVRRILDRADATRPPVGGGGTGYVEVNDGELLVLTSVIGDAREYMNANDYADDWSLPEDAAAATVFRNTDCMGCWTDVVDLHRADQAVRSILAAGDLLYDEAAAVNAGR